jgi:hypothetical protein
VVTAATSRLSRNAAWSFSGALYDFLAIDASGRTEVTP